jgi:precorrin-2 dehydrogenase/sirohydrochlorin ferrochelatase
MTIPLALDLALLPTALTGGGPALLKRLGLLDAERVPGLTVYAPQPDAALASQAGGRLVPRLPTALEIAGLRVLFVAGLQMAQSAELAGIARDHRVLVNVEDVLPFCDFHVPAILRRGDLAVSISTGGASPTLSRRLKAYLAEMLPPEWEQRTARIAAMREKMRVDGSTYREVMDATIALIEAEGWLPPD